MNPSIESHGGLIVDRLGFAYPRQRALFTDWSHRFEPGLTWVRGTNGCGKSTLLRLLGGALDPDRGSIRIGGSDVARERLEYRRRVYWCGPDSIAFDHLKPMEFFGFIAGLYPRFDADEARRWIDAFALDGFLPRRIDQLSTGTRRKVAVIAAMASGADVVLMDEPLGGLDRASLQLLTNRLDAVDDAGRIWIVASHESLGAAEARARSLMLE